MAFRTLQAVAMLTQIFAGPKTDTYPLVQWTTIPPTILIILLVTCSLPTPCTSLRVFTPFQLARALPLEEAVELEKQFRKEDVALKVSGPTFRAVKTPLAQPKDLYNPLPRFLLVGHREPQ
ncbi:hypothetical protein K439DRAFT_1617355 [Ramaria rubella]|nr:hypothetical protein K439DRAFT_1617355 [Ramaria rubella]